MKGRLGQIDPPSPPGKATFKNPSLIRVKQTSTIIIPTIIIISKVHENIF